jgi:hypothetical protein
MEERSRQRVIDADLARQRRSDQVIEEQRQAAINAKADANRLADRKIFEGKQALVDLIYEGRPENVRRASVARVAAMCDRDPNLNFLSVELHTGALASIDAETEAARAENACVRCGSLQGHEDWCPSDASPEERKGSY